MITVFIDAVKIYFDFNSDIRHAHVTRYEYGGHKGT